MSNPQNDILTPNKIRELAAQFQTSRIILTAVELNIFSLLDKRLLASSEVASMINANSRATDRLMNALVALGFLKKTRSKFYNSDAASQYLVKGKPEFMGGLFHTNELWKTWSTLTKAVRAGTTVYNDDEYENNWTESFIAAMHYRGVKEAKIISMMIESNNPQMMLDVGGGSGAFSMAFIERFAGMKATVFDLPDIIPLTKKYVETYQYKNNFEYITGDYLEDDFGTGYDLILLSAIVHINSFEQNEKLIQKCYHSLNSKGQIIIKDWVMSEERTAPLGGAIFALNMLVGTECGDTYTESEIKSWLLNAGISKIERKDTSFGNSLIIGYKN